MFKIVSSVIFLLMRIKKDLLINHNHLYKGYFQVFILSALLVFGHGSHMARWLTASQPVSSMVCYVPAISSFEAQLELVTSTVTYFIPRLIVHPLYKS